MGKNDFTYRQCVRALLKLGFREVSVRSGNHDKFRSPFDDANPSFIMVPRHRVLHCQKAILKELKTMGGEDLVERFFGEI